MMIIALFLHWATQNSSSDDKSSSSSPSLIILQPAHDLTQFTTLRQKCIFTIYHTFRHQDLPHEDENSAGADPAGLQQRSRLQEPALEHNRVPVRLEALQPIEVKDCIAHAFITILRYYNLHLCSVLESTQPNRFCTLWCTSATVRPLFSSILTSSSSSVFVSIDSCALALGLK